ncbi:hypothetical protein PsYK624_077660 [Phanerochaete sordida]|uniref:Uncharacterized protein n=1 Tax=Phanerochaete sordida TaxID=48140 RepID=A0A9P3LDK5_9APHY|nr:hypothetical protein PsYK624_077660 [Phanerochaete sordida]
MFPSPAPLLALLLLFVSPLLAQPPKGTITTPTANTAIQPGANFSFAYHPLADYGVSTYAVHVWLLDVSGVPHNASAVTPLGISAVSGHYFGRFDYANYPAVPYPKNPLPSVLTMPDFSVAPGGFGSGEHASNLPLQLTVIEEFGGFAPSIGNNLSIAATTIIYNATSTK